MRNFLFKTVLMTILVLLAGVVLNAQSTNYKRLIGEVQALQKQIVPDKRVAVLDISLQDTLKPIVVLKGKTDQPEAKKKLLQLLNDRGIHYTDSIVLLPEASLGDKTWALTTLSVASMRTQPDHAAEMATQSLMGTPMKVLESCDGWYRVQTPDLYIGWMEGKGLVLFTAPEMERWKQSNRFVFNRISGNAFDSPDSKGMPVCDLVQSDIFEMEGEVKGYLKIRIPDGRTGYVRKKDCLSWNEWINCKPSVQSIISFARQLLGVPYLWGGTSSKNVDCSGFTKTSYFTQGVILARDASQQVKYGDRLVYQDKELLQPGDLLFFGHIPQRITHVGMYLGNGKYIHASGLVRINSLDPNDPAFSEALLKNLRSSSRILNSLNTEGITLVKDHPWYSVGTSNK